MRPIFRCFLSLEGRIWVINLVHSEITRPRARTHKMALQSCGRYGQIGPYFIVNQFFGVTVNYLPNFDSRAAENSEIMFIIEQNNMNV